MPWAQDATVQVLHDRFNHDGSLVQFAPRSITAPRGESVCQRGLVAGVCAGVGVLFGEKHHPNQPLIPPVGRNGRREAVASRTVMTR